VRYVAFAHNEWDADTRRSKAKVLYNFGHEDRLDRDALTRLVASINRYLGVDDPPAADATGADTTATAETAEALPFIAARRLGGVWALDGLWDQLGIRPALSKLAAGRRFTTDVERVVFALVANRALEPTSKLAATQWVAERAWIGGLEQVSDDACYRAMDWLLDVADELAEQTYWATADLLNLEVDLLFFDTTSTYFETDTADLSGEAVVGFRSYGKSKDHRPDLPQVVIGMAVTRTGIPIRVWTWPGNTSDSPLIRQVKDDLRAWKLSRVVWVTDRGFASEQNRRHLQRAGGHYICGEKLRGDSPEAAAALARQGRYRTVTGNLRVKEVVVDDGVMRDRFVICLNPDAAERDKTVRDQLLARLTEQIADTDRLDPQERGRRATARGAAAVPAHHARRQAARRPGRGRRGGQAGRQVPAAHVGSDAVGRGCGAGLQAAAGGRARLAGHEVDPGAAAGVPPARGPHPRARRPVLAGAATHPGRRDQDRRHLAQPASRARPAPRRRVHRRRRHRPPTHRHHQPATRDPGPTGRRRATALPPRQPHRGLTRTTSPRPGRLGTHPCPGDLGVPAGQPNNPTSVLERPRVPGAMARPRHLRDHSAVLAAAHPRRIGL